MIPLREQRARHPDVACAANADERGRGILAQAKWTRGRHGDQGATFRTKTVVPLRPSESLTSILTMCSPTGSSTSGISIPAVCTNDFMRGVKSTVGVLR